MNNVDILGDYSSSFQNKGKQIIVQTGFSFLEERKIFSVEVLTQFWVELNMTRLIPKISSLAKA